MAWFGKSEHPGAGEPERTALERAADVTADGPIEQAVARFVDGVLDKGIDGAFGFESATTVAATALSRTGSIDAAIESIVRQHLARSGIEGFVTGAGGFITWPVALPANLAAFYLLATRMVASIAELRGYDLKDERVRAAVMLTLVGADADELLAKAGFAPSAGFLTSMAAERLPGPAMMVLNKAIVFRLLAKTGTNVLGRLGRGVPLVGGAFGAGLDAWLMREIAQAARREFPPATRTTPDTHGGEAAEATP